MSKPLTKKDLPRFAAINKYNVAIKSLRNKLKTAKGLDELTNIAAKIIELENQILVERTNGYRQLEDEKKTIENRIDRLQRELQNANHDLKRVGNSLDHKLNGYRKKLQTKIDSLNEEYVMIMGYISSPSNSPTVLSPSLSSSSLTSMNLAYTVKPPYPAISKQDHSKK